jgi:hypothetical protein
LIANAEIVSPSAVTACISSGRIVSATAAAMRPVKPLARYSFIRKPMVPRFMP